MDLEYAEPLDVASLARTAHMSPGHFARRFRDEYGETPYHYLMTGGSNAPRGPTAAGPRRSCR
jgi:AraC-like DNA-binding protein